MLGLAGPVLALWFAAREPALSLETIPFHRSVSSDARGTPPRAFVGTVESFPVPSGGERARGFSFLFKTSVPMPGRQTHHPALYRVSLESDRPPVWGATIRLDAVIESPKPPPNPGQLDMRRVLRAQGAEALLRVEAENPWKALRPPSPWRRFLIRTRAALGASLTRHIPPPGLPLLEAALLNDVSHVTTETSQAFLRSGMQHILAISGQHIGLLLAFLLAIALIIRLPRKAAFVIAGILTAIYIPLTGAPVSVVRSGLMLACLMPGVLLERPSAGLHALCLTAALDLLIDPFNILNLGFQLSYAATLALILCSKPASHAAGVLLPEPAKPGKRKRQRAWAEMRGVARTVGRGVIQMILLSIMVTLFTYAPLAASTHAMAPWGILGNLITVPVSAVMLVGGLCVWTLDGALPSACGFLAHAVGAVTGLSAIALEGCVFFLARLPGALRPVAEASNGWLAAFVSISLFVTLLARSGRFLLAGLVTACLVTAEGIRPVLSRPRPGEARVTFLAVGHGDAAVIELAGKTLLIDAGDSPRVAKQIILPYLRYRGIGRLDAVLLTHPDLDHYGGAAALTEGIPIGFVLGPRPAAESTASWNCLLRSVRSQGIPWTEGRAGQRLYTAPGVSIWMLGPGSSLDSADKNNRSLVALLTAGDRRVLFTGDIEGPGQTALESTWPLWRGAWLKAPHHGSDRTTLPCFVAAAAAPRVAISCGGRRGFPGPRTVEAFRETGSRIEITRDTGAVVWTAGSGP